MTRTDLAKAGAAGLFTAALALLGVKPSMIDDSTARILFILCVIGFGICLIVIVIGEKAKPPPYEPGSGRISRQPGFIAEKQAYAEEAARQRAIDDAQKRRNRRAARDAPKPEAAPD